MPLPVSLQPWEWPDRPWSKLHLDFVGSFMGLTFLVMVDARTKWLEENIIAAGMELDIFVQRLSILY